MAAGGKLTDLNLALNRGQSSLETKVDALTDVIKEQSAQIRHLTYMVKVLSRYVIEGVPIRKRIANQSQSFRRRSGS